MPSLALLPPFFSLPLHPSLPSLSVSFVLFFNLFGYVCLCYGVNMEVSGQHVVSGLAFHLVKGKAPERPRLVLSLPPILPMGVLLLQAHTSMPHLAGALSVWIQFFVHPEKVLQPPSHLLSFFASVLLWLFLSAPSVSGLTSFLSLSFTSFLFPEYKPHGRCFSFLDCNIPLCSIIP